MSLANTNPLPEPNWQRKNWVALILVLCGLAITLNLGFWQLRRASLKETFATQERAALYAPALSNADLLKFFPKQSASSPHKTPQVDASSSAELVAKLNSRRVSLKGVWLPEFTQFLENRPHPEGKAGLSGYIVVTPFRLALQDDTSTSTSTNMSSQLMLVQRGWLPRGGQRLNVSELPTLTQAPDAALKAEGTLVPQVSRIWQPSAPEKTSPRSAAEARQLLSLGLSLNYPMAALQSELSVQGLELLPVVLQQTSPSIAASTARTEVGSHSPASASNISLLQTWAQPSFGIDKHYGYAFQWFALSAVLAALSAYWGLYRGIWIRRKHEK